MLTLICDTVCCISRVDYTPSLVRPERLVWHRRRFLEAWRPLLLCLRLPVCITLNHLP